MFLGAQKRTGVSRLSKEARSLFRNVEIEHHQPVGAAFERCDQSGAGALMRFMHEIGVAGGGIAEVDGEGNG